MLKRLFLFSLCLAALLMFSCGGKQYPDQKNKDIEHLLKVKPPYPATKFVVLTDPHFYDSSLGTTGSAFQEYLDRDRKMLTLSQEIMATAVEEIIKEDADFVLICGDLTKDGEALSHQGVVSALTKIKAAGKDVYVVPGNHDIANGDAVRFLGDTTEAVPTVSAQGFKELYKELGYGAAVDEDSDSLSYVFEPVQGLWVMALDSCRWKENQPGHPPITGGAFSGKTFQWIERTLIQSKKNNVAVIVFLHHGIMEHYPANEKYYAQYIIDDYENVSKMFASYGVSLVFTGHFHAQDITLQRFKDSDHFIYDIETGSLSTSPCPYRLVEFTEDQTALIQSKFISSIPSHKDDFHDYASQYVFNGTIKLANAKLVKYKVSKEQQALLSPQISKAYCTHLKGDEKKPEIVVNKKGLTLWSKFIVFMQKGLINGWWTDLAPQDNTLKIDLKTGEFFEHEG